VRRALLKVTPLALLIAGVLAAPAPAALETIVQDDPGLLYRSPAQVTATAQRLKQLGTDRVRITASWSSLTRDAESNTKPAGFDATDPAAYEQARWAQLDNAVRAVRAAGMRVLIDIGFWAPHWATTDPPGPRARTNIDPAAYAEFATAIARRYSGSFVPSADPGPAPPPNEDQSILGQIFGPFTGGGGARAAQADGALPSVDSYALWNEPNIPALLMPQWKGATPVSPDRYRLMVRAAYPAVKAVSRGAQVLIGNTSSTGGRRGSGPVAPLEFLRELACVDSKLRPRKTPECAGFQPVPGDGWAHHPYSQNERPPRRSSPRTERGDLRMADLPVLASTLSRLAKAKRISRSNAAIYLTEFGYETGRIRGRPTISQTTQARWLTWAESIAERVPAVKSFAQFLLRDQPPAPVQVTNSLGRPGGEFFSGLLTADGKDKIAARTFQAGLFAQRSGRKRVRLYGRLRLGPGRKAIVVQRRVGKGPWRTAARVTVDGRASFTRRQGFRRGARYRLRYPGPGGRAATGLAVPVVPAG
jgi:hypothetical protein